MGFFSSDKKSTVNTNTQSTSTTGWNTPDWYKQYTENNVNKGMSILDQLSQVTGDERYEDFTPDELMAQNLVRGNVGKYDDVISQSLSALQAAQGRAATGPTASDIQGLMNPYTQNVIDNNKLEAIRQNDIARNQIGNEALASRAFGGSRQAILEAENGRNLNTTLNNIQDSGLQTAYNTALNQWNANQNASNSAALNSINAANGASSLNLNNINALNTSGQNQRGLQQQITDFNYTNPLQTVLQGQDLLNSIQIGNIYGTTTNSSSSSSQVSKEIGAGAGWGSKLLGGAMAIGGIMSGNPLMAANGLSSVLSNPNQSTGGTQNRADGGPILRLANGGGVTKAIGDMLDVSKYFEQAEEAGTPTSKINRGLKEFIVDPVVDTTTAAVPGILGALNGLAGNNNAREYYYDQASDLLKSATDGYTGGVSDVGNALLSGLTPREVQAADERTQAPARLSSEDQAFLDGITVEDAVPANPVEAAAQPQPLAPITDEETLNPVGAAAAPVQGMNPLASMSTLEQGQRLSTGIQQPESTIVEDDVVNTTNRKSALQQMIDGTNLPLLRAGLAMMASDKPFAQALSAGGTAYADEIVSQRKTAAESKQKAIENAREQAKNQIDSYSKETDRLGKINEGIKNQNTANYQQGSLAAKANTARIYEKSVDNNYKAALAKVGNDKKAQDNFKAIKANADTLVRALADPMLDEGKRQEYQRSLDATLAAMNAYATMGSQGQGDLSPVQQPPADNSNDVQIETIDLY